MNKYISPPISESLKHQGYGENSLIRGSTVNKFVIYPLVLILAALNFGFYSLYKEPEIQKTKPPIEVALKTLPQPYEKQIMIKEPKKTISISGLEAEVDRHVKELLGEEQKNSLENAFSESTKYRDYIENASMQTNIDENLLTAIMATESNSDLRKYSKAGAAGPMQLMPTTAKDLGLMVNNFIDERISPDSILPATKYFEEQLNKYNNVVVALISYNCGPTFANRLVEKYGTDWDNIKENLPKETRDYVIKVLSRKEILDNERYGIRITQQPLFSDLLENSILHTVKKGQTIYGISEMYGTKIDKIEELNPHIRNYSKIFVGQEIRIPKT